MNNSDEIAEAIAKVLFAIIVPIILVFFITKHPIISLMIGFFSGAVYSYRAIPWYLQFVIAAAGATYSYNYGEQLGESFKGLFNSLTGILFILAIMALISDKSPKIVSQTVKSLWQVIIFITKTIPVLIIVYSIYAGGALLTKIILSLFLTIAAFVFFSKKIHDVSNKLYKKLLREAVLIIFSSVSLMSLLSLISFHDTDQGYLNNVKQGPVDNWMGVIGAGFADALTSLFGCAAGFIPVIIGLAGLSIYRENIRGRQWLYLLSLRGCGFVVTLLTTCGLAEIYFNGFYYEKGGFVGEAIGLGLLNELNMLGATAVLLVLWVPAVLFFSGAIFKKEWMIKDGFNNF